MRESGFLWSMLRKAFSTHEVFPQVVPKAADGSGFLGHLTEYLVEVTQLDCLLFSVCDSYRVQSSHLLS